MNRRYQIITKTKLRQSSFVSVPHCWYLQSVAISLKFCVSISAIVFDTEPIVLQIQCLSRHLYCYFVSVRVCKWET